MSHQVDQVEIAPVTSASEDKKPGEIAEIFKSIRCIFDASKAPPAQPQVLEVTDELEWNKDTALEALRQLSEPLSVEQFFELAEKSSWNTHYVYHALEKLRENLSVDQFLEIAEKSNWEYHVTLKSFGMLDGTLSFEQVLKIGEQARWSVDLVAPALKKIDGTLSFEQVCEISEQAQWDIAVVSRALQKMDGLLSAEQFLEITKKSGQYYNVVFYALEKLDGTLSVDQFLELAERSNYTYNVVYHAIKKLDGRLSVDQVLELVEQSGWESNIVREALNKLSRTLSVDQILQLAERSRYNPYVVYRAFEKLEGTLSVDQVLKIAKQSGWNNKFVCEALNKLRGNLPSDYLFEIAVNTKWKYNVLHYAFEKLDEPLPMEFVLKIFKNRDINDEFASEIISKLLADNRHTSMDYTELISELTQNYPEVLLVNLERFRANDTIQLANTLIKNKDHELVIDHLSHFPQEHWAEIIRLLMQGHQLEKYQLTPLLSYIDFVDEQTKNDLSSKLLSSSATAFYPELLENETPRAVGQFGSFGKEEQITKLAQLKEGRFYKALLVLSKAYGYSADQVGFTFEDILSEIKILVTNNNDKHLFDLISLAVLLFPEKETELQNIRETFSTQNSSPTEEMKPREKFAQFEALKEIFEYYAMITLAGRYNIDLLPHSLTSRITDKINTLYEKIKEYIVIAVSSELRHSNDFESRMFGKYGNILYKFGTPEDIRVFFERAKFDFPKKSNYPGDYYGGPSWATIADFGAQFWADSAQTDLSTKITLLNLAVSLQHNSGYFFDKDDRIKIENQELTKLLDFEARGERTFESFLKYGLENNILSQKEYDEYVQLNNTLASATEQLPTRVDSNQIYLRQMVQEAKKQIEAIQNNPAIPFEIKMEAQAVFSKTEGFSRKENYRLYLSNLLKTISINWENIDDTIKRFQSGNQVIYSVSIAGYDLAYWYEDGKLITIHSMDELKQQRQKLSQLLNQPIVAAQFGYVREGD